VQRFIAVRRAAHMAQENKLEHDMAYVAQRLNGAGVCWSGLGEIIAWERGYPDYDYDRTMQLWWNSPPHHDVMMGNGYNAAGGAWDTANDGGQSTALASTISAPATIWSVGVNALMPLLDWGRTSARVGEATARRDQAIATYRKATETAFREVADALTEVRVYRDVEREVQERAATARNTLALVNTRYRSGYSAYLEVLDAQRTANDAELAVERNRLALLAASVNLMKALGGGWPS